jgi:hypothetical protein
MRLVAIDGWVNIPLKDSELLLPQWVQSRD